MSVKTCKHGHPQTADNRYETRDGGRCATCQRLHIKNWKERHKGEVRKLTVDVAEALFQELKREAERRNLTFAALVREKLTAPTMEQEAVLLSDRIDQQYAYPDSPEGSVYRTDEGLI